jgi:uncharacterized protein DUF6884
MARNLWLHTAALRAFPCNIIDYTLIRPAAHSGRAGPSSLVAVPSSSTRCLAACSLLGPDDAHVALLTAVHCTGIAPRQATQRGSLLGPASTGHLVARATRPQCAMRWAESVLFTVLVTPRFTYLVPHMCSARPLPMSEKVVPVGHDVDKLRGVKDGKQYRAYGSVVAPALYHLANSREHKEPAIPPPTGWCLCAAAPALRHKVQRHMSRPQTVVFVACVGQKGPDAAPARALYTSAWFIKARRFAESHAGTWYILSAKYGLVAPDQTLAPYDATLNTMRLAERQRWAAETRRQIIQVVDVNDRLVFLAGRRYHELITPVLVDLGYTVEASMQGLGIGQQLAWLDRQACALASCSTGTS